jgi:uncharacterized protein YaaQ
MKLILAIIHDDDCKKVIGELNSKGYKVTRLSSTGGFLRTGNTTLLIGVDDKKVNNVIQIIKANSRSRKQIVPYNHVPYELDGTGTDYHYNLEANSVLAEMSYPTEIVVGGATVFVLGVERFE